MRISDWSSDVCSSDLKAGELRIIAWRLTADSNLDPGLVRLADCLGDHPGDGRVPLVEQLGEDARVPVHAKHELGQVVGPDRKAVEPGRELFGKHDVGRYFAHHIDLTPTPPPATPVFGLSPQPPVRPPR